MISSNFSEYIKYLLLLFLLLLPVIKITLLSFGVNILFDEEEVLFWFAALILITIVIIINRYFCYNFNKIIRKAFQCLILFLKIIQNLLILLFKKILSYRNSIVLNNWMYDFKRDVLFILQILIFTFPYFIFTWLFLFFENYDFSDFFYNTVNECGQQHSTGTSSSTHSPKTSKTTEDILKNEVNAKYGLTSDDKPSTSKPNSIYVQTQFDNSFKNPSISDASNLTPHLNNNNKDLENLASNNSEKIIEYGESLKESAHEVIIKSADKIKEDGLSQGFNQNSYQANHWKSKK